MKDLQVFRQFPSYKKLGYTASETACCLGVSKDTVKKYWELNTSEINKLYFKNNKMQKLSRHETAIINFLNRNTMMSARKISELIYSLFGESYSERTVSRYLKELRYKYGYHKT